MRAGAPGVMSATERGAGRRLRVARSAVALLVIVGSGLCATSGASAQAPPTEVDVQLEVGEGGLVADAAAMPVQVTMVSDRARTVDVILEWDSGRRTYRSELPAGAPTVLDLSLPTPSGGLESIRVDVRDGSRSLGDDMVEVEVAHGSTIVGIGSSMASAGAPETAATVGGVQDARLVELTDASWTRPGRLESMSTVVLGAQDVDRLTGEQVAQLRGWVWRGGELVIDAARAEVLPVVELPSAAGARTGVGSGWVRFSDGRAALGGWSEVLEPAMVRTTLSPSVDMWMGDEWVTGGLVAVEFLSVWAIVAAVFGSALLAGPGLWLVLRTRRRRRLMWIGAPGVSLLVAGLLLVAGQGVFTSAEVTASSSIVVDPWNGSGSVSMGLKESEVLELPAGAELTASSPVAVVTDTGTGSTARIDVGRNSFGTLSVSPVDLVAGPSVSVTAIAGTEGTVDVTVTNDADTDLVGVVVLGAGRARPFSDVPAGSSVTLPFEVLEDIAPFAAMFDATTVPIDGGGMGMEGDFVAGPIWSGLPVGQGTSLPLSRGVVVITGSLGSDITALGRTLPGRSEITAIAPIHSTVPSAAALRIDAVGPPSSAAEVDEGLIGEEGPIVAEEFVRTLQYARLTAVAGRPAAICDLHTVAEDLRFWNGSEWTPAEKVGVPRGSARMAAQEVQEWMVPEIPAGGALLARVSVGLPVDTPLLFDCAGR